MNPGESINNGQQIHVVDNATYAIRFQYLCFRLLQNGIIPKHGRTQISFKICFIDINLSKKSYLLSE